MGEYIAIIKCCKCGKVLAKIKAHLEPGPDTFIPQGSAIQEFGLPETYCQDCLNKPTEESL